MHRPVLALLAAGVVSTAAAQGVPQLDYRGTCAQTPAVGMDKKATEGGCIRDEEQARDQLPPVWSKSSQRSRSECLTETTQGGLPSYVELISCLEGNLSLQGK
mgnify:FL=1